MTGKDEVLNNWHGEMLNNWQGRDAEQLEARC